MRIFAVFLLPFIFFGCTPDDKLTEIIQFSSTRYIVQILPREILSSNEYNETSYKDISVKISMRSNGKNQAKIFNSSELSGVASNYLPYMETFSIDNKSSILTISGYINASCPSVVSILYFDKETYKILYNGVTYGPEIERIGEKVGFIFPAFDYFGERICWISLLKSFQSGKLVNDTQVNSVFFRNQVQELKATIGTEKKIDNELFIKLAYSYFVLDDFVNLEKLFSERETEFQRNDGT